MKILYFTKGGRNVASSNERVWIIGDLLKTHYNVESAVVPSPEATLYTTLTKLLARDYDVVIVHKSIFTALASSLIVGLCMLLRAPLVFDLDDAQWVHSPRKSRWFARTASAVFAGSHEIMNWAKKYNKNVILMPTLVDHAHFARRSVTHGKKPVYTIGWVGSGPEHFKKGNFHIIKPALEELASRGHKFRFRVVGARDHKPLMDFLKSAKFESDIISFVPYDMVPQEIQKFDIGIMPLQDNPFERAKCGAKAIQYMACRVPPVVSPVGENTIIVDHGVNGFWARSEDAWVTALETLLQDAAMRREFGERGQKKVEAKYSHEAVLAWYKTALETL